MRWKSWLWGALVLASWSGLGAAPLRDALPHELASAVLDLPPTPGWAGGPAPVGFQPAAGPALSAYRRLLVDRGWSAPGVWHTAGLLTSGHRRLGVNVFVPPGEARGVFLFVHGYQSHAAEFGALLSAVVRRGWMVVTLDLPGHGFSSGPRSDIDDFAEYGDAVADWLRWVDDHPGWPAIPILAAHSLGTAACLEALRRPSTPVPSRVWFLAPLWRPAWFPVLAWTQDVLGSLVGEVGWSLGSDADLGGQTTSVHWFQALRTWLGRLEAQPPLGLPLTIWSGDRDTVVDAEGTRREYQRLVPGVDYRRLPGMDHTFLTDGSERQQALALVLTDLDRITAPAPPGTVGPVPGETTPRSSEKCDTRGF